MSGNGVGASLNINILQGFAEDLRANECCRRTK